MNNIFLTFDMDWADDGVLTHFLNLMNDKDLTGTLNVTHKTNVFQGGGKGLSLEYIQIIRVC